MKGEKNSRTNKKYYFGMLGNEFIAECRTNPKDAYKPLLRELNKIQVVFIQKKNKGIVYAQYDERLKFIYDNRKRHHCVKLLGGYIFIKNVSFSCATELLRNNNIPFKIMIEL